MSKEGLMQVAAVRPPDHHRAFGFLRGSDLDRISRRFADKGGPRLALAYAAYRFVNKKVGLTIGLVAAGTAAAESLHTYQASTIVSGPSTRPPEATSAADRTLAGPP